MGLNARSCIYFPIFASLLFAIGIWICYAIAVSLNHVALVPKWPFVSDLGITSPESCIFTLVFSWGSTVFLLISFVFHKFVRDRGFKTRLNNVALGFGFTTAIGISIVGSFQWTNVLSVHFIGAGLSFVGGTIYCWLLVVISWKYFRLTMYSNPFVAMRIILVSVESIFLILFLGFSYPAFIYGNFITVCTSMEWGLVFTQLLFYSSLGYDFNHIRNFNLDVKHVDIEAMGRADQAIETTEITTSTTSYH